MQGPLRFVFVVTDFIAVMVTENSTAAEFVQSLYHAKPPHRLSIPVSVMVDLSAKRKSGHIFGKPVQTAIPQSKLSSGRFSSILLLVPVVLINSPLAHLKRISGKSKQWSLSVHYYD